jgi:putative PIN family toxin of toxin-antitoxin system
MKVVFDTNVLIAAFITDGLCSKILFRAKRGEFELYLCPSILNEFQEKLRNKIGADPTETREAISLIREAACVKMPEKAAIKVHKVCRDPDDDEILACAVAMEADYLVTGDSDLQEIKNYGSVKIISPRSFEMLFEE